MRPEVQIELVKAFASMLDTHAVEFDEEMTIMLRDVAGILALVLDMRLPGQGPRDPREIIGPLGAHPDFKAFLGAIRILRRAG